eukprot:GILK01008978.1.p1 GENE.GILK01008978.1~~GILK01008978.1.p1  ORF type:complete len:439 (+),score=20.42 GILK01008978.1:2-1318(+)
MGVFRGHCASCCCVSASRTSRSPMDFDIARAAIMTCVSSGPKVLSEIGTQTRWKTRFRFCCGPLKLFIVECCSDSLVVDSVTQLVWLKQTPSVSAPSAIEVNSPSQLRAPYSTEKHAEKASVSESTTDLSSILQKEFECIICLEVAENAVVCSSCDVMCCEKCVQALSSCAHCRKSPFAFAPNVALRRLISRLPVVCEHCNGFTTKAGLSHHMTEQCSAPAACPHEGCTLAVERRLLRAHEQECGFAKVACLHCALQTARNDLNRHFRICPSRIVTCRFCSMQLQFRLLDQHNTDHCPVNFETCQHCKSSIHKNVASQHQSTCSERRVKCRHCNRMIRFNAYSTHVQSCSSRSERCGYCRRSVSAGSISEHYNSNQCVSRCSGCDRYYVSRLLEEHEAVCSMVDVQCMKCRQWIPRMYIYEHEDQGDCFEEWSFTFPR